MTFKFKFRVFIEKFCRPCKEVHQAPTHRYIFHQTEGADVDEARQRSHLKVVSMLDKENREEERRKKNQHQRPLWQRDIEVV